VVNTVTAAEAWQSGGNRWTQARRTAYINDLADRRMSTVASKRAASIRGEKDPATWLPTKAARCQYITEWTVTKIRWGLTADTAEKTKMATLANSCANLTITVTRK
jgi:hypothetical protein